MVPELPNTLFSDGRSVLAKFGYVHFDGEESRDDWAQMWELLRGDFPLPKEQVPTFTELNEEARQAAQTYMKTRLLADHYLDDCERLHVQIFTNSIATDLVEDYAQARDRYEHTVEDFGEARVNLQDLLSRVS